MYRGPITPSISSRSHGCGSRLENQGGPLICQWESVLSFWEPLHDLPLASHFRLSFPIELQISCAKVFTHPKPTPKTVSMMVLFMPLHFCWSNETSTYSSVTNYAMAFGHGFFCIKGPAENGEALIFTRSTQKFV